MAPVAALDPAHFRKLQELISRRSFDFKNFGQNGASGIQMFNGRRGRKPCPTWPSPPLPAIPQGRQQLPSSPSRIANPTRKVYVDALGHASIPLVEPMRAAAAEAYGSERSEFQVDACGPKGSRAQESGPMPSGCLPAAAGRREGMYSVYHPACVRASERLLIQKRLGVNFASSGLI